MRISLYNFMHTIKFSAEPFTWSSIKKVFEETGLIYYSFKDDFKSYGYINIKYLPDSLKDCSSSSSFEHNILENSELSEIFQKKGIRSNKWGKLLNTFIEDCPQSAIDHFMTLLNVQNNDSSENSFRILEDVQDAYNNSSISSCMTDEDIDLVQIYKKIGVKYLQQLDSNGNEVSRSLLWPNVRKLSSDDDDKFDMIQLCDRIYSQSIGAYTNHVKYAIGLGYHVRHRQNCEDYSKIWQPGEEFKTDNRGYTFLEFKLSDSNIDLDDLKGIPWPYLDTFRFWNEKDQTFRNYIDDNFKYYECRNTDGESPYWSSKEECSDCGSECDPDDMSRIDGDLYCPDCYNVCDVCGEAYRNNDLHEVRSSGIDHICNSCLDRSDTYVLIPSDWCVIDRDNAVYCSDVEEWFREGADHAYCVSDDRYYRNYDHLVLFENEFYLPDCPKLKELQAEALECEVTA